MKNVCVIVVMLFCSVMSGQELVKKSKSCRAVLDVKGNCEMCKARIEKSVLKTKGVKYAAWDIESKKLKLIYNQFKVSEVEIKNSIMAVGHDVDTLKASDALYQKLHFCCQYRETK